MLSGVRRIFWESELSTINTELAVDSRVCISTKSTVSSMSENDAKRGNFVTSFLLRFLGVLATSELAKYAVDHQYQ